MANVIIAVRCLCLFRDSRVGFYTCPLRHFGRCEWRLFITHSGPANVGNWPGRAAGGRYHLHRLVTTPGGRSFVSEADLRETTSGHQYLTHANSSTPRRRTNAMHGIAVNLLDRSALRSAFYLRAPHRSANQHSCRHRPAGQLRSQTSTHRWQRTTPLERCRPLSLRAAAVGISAGRHRLWLRS